MWADGWFLLSSYAAIFWLYYEEHKQWFLNILTTMSNIQFDKEKKQITQLKEMAMSQRMHMGDQND